MRSPIDFMGPSPRPFPKEEERKLPDFLTREDPRVRENRQDEFMPRSAPAGMPFPFGGAEPQIRRDTPMERPKTPPKDDALGFDVDELVKKIDAKIAELEAEEKRNKEQEQRKANPIPKDMAKAVPKIPTAPTPEEISNSITDILNHKMEPPKSKIPQASIIEEKKLTNIVEENKPLQQPVIKSPLEEMPFQQQPKPNTTSLNLEDDSDDDDFFDDFFDN